MMATYEQKQQAWQVVDSAVARLQITREQHVGLQHAMQLIKPADPANAVRGSKNPEDHIPDAGKMVHECDTPETPGPREVKK